MPKSSLPTLPESDQINEVLGRALTAEELDDLLAASDEPVDVTFSSQDFDVAGLVRRLSAGSMLIPQLGATDDRVDTAGFQRGFVWSKSQMDKFIESLLLGYPVPGIFLIKQSENNRLLVLDGQQRLVTLERFQSGRHNGKPFALSNVSEAFRGLTYATLPEPLKLKFDDSYMQATIVAADGSAEVNNAIYQIFERLNSGGTQLTPHEIRVALAAGDLISYLEDMNSGLAWRSLYGNRSARLRDQELILRIIALYLNADRYSRPLKKFLNEFATTHRNLTPEVKAAGELFIRACKQLADEVGAAAFRRPDVNQVNVAQAEAVTVGLMRALFGGKAPTDLDVKVHVLRLDPQFESATTRATADNDSVALRLKMATQALTAT